MGQWNIADSDWLISGINIWFSHCSQSCGSKVVLLLLLLLLLLFFKHLVFSLCKLLITSRIVKKCLCLDGVIATLSEDDKSYKCIAKFIFKTKQTTVDFSNKETSLSELTKLVKQFFLKMISSQQIINLVNEGTSCTSWQFKPFFSYMNDYGQPSVIKSSLK